MLQRSCSGRFYARRVGSSVRGSRRKTTERNYKEQHICSHTSLTNIVTIIYYQEGTGSPGCRMMAVTFDASASKTNLFILYRGSLKCFPSLTIAVEELSVVSALLVQFALLRGGFARRPLHEEVEFAESALLSRGGIQWLALLLEGAAGLVSVSLTFVGQEGTGDVLGVSWERPKVVRLVLPALRRSIIRIHGCHVAVWNAGLGVHA